ncbi:pyridoxamine 5'-phosphate oxidase family protein [Vandammella animalimorsus]|uniref:pyridoxamine 5'-phosphate oxidase family protein n=1 Tax=Vandammella animalimorsus TaxID=2029117 RepID=UPI00325BD561
MSTPTHAPITPAIRQAAQDSVLCWLATVDEAGWPNVSPKEIFAVLDDEHLVIAHIASPQSVRNIERHPQVCVSFVDVFKQKGFKLRGHAQLACAGDASFAAWSAPLAPLAGERFTIAAVIRVRVTHAEPVLAPSYRFYPESTTEAGQQASALARYGVQWARSATANTHGKPDSPTQENPTP